MTKKELEARLFCRDVCRMAEKRGLPVFVVTDGASATRPKGCDAVIHARNAHIEWEKANGFDPEHDWSKDIRS